MWVSGLNARHNDLLARLVKTLGKLHTGEGVVLQFRLKEARQSLSGDWNLMLEPRGDLDISGMPKWNKSNPASHAEEVAVFHDQCHKLER